MKGKIFNAQEVQAILNGSKVMFREVVKNNLLKSCYKIGSYDSFTGKSESEMMPCNHSWAGKRIDMICSDCWKELLAKCPYQVGQKIFVKETFSYSNQPWCDKTIFYKASHGDRIQHTFSVSQRENKWRSPMVMQEYDSRLTPLIKEIRVERLGEISEEDAIAEGVSKIGFHELLNKEQSNGFLSRISGKKYQYYPQEFRKLWNATHKKPEEKFEANSWVWVCTMEVVK